VPAATLVFQCLQNCLFITVTSTPDLPARLSGLISRAEITDELSAENKVPATAIDWSLTFFSLDAPYQLGIRFFRPQPPHLIKHIPDAQEYTGDQESQTKQPELIQDYSNGLALHIELRGGCRL
jgi:hypothetical protein